MTYKQYDKKDLLMTKNWFVLARMKSEDVQAIEKEWKEIEVHNTAIATEVRKLFDEKVKEIDAALIAAGSTTHFKSAKKTLKKEWESWFDNKVLTPLRIKMMGGQYAPAYPYAHGNSAIENGITLWNGQSPTSIVQLHDKLSKQLFLAENLRKQKDEAYKKAIALSIVLGLDTSNLSMNDIVSKVDEIMKDKYLEDYPDGSVTSIDSCECETYIMGEHRCSCGNRRINSYVEGSLLNGYYLVNEAY